MDKKNSIIVLLLIILFVLTLVQVNHAQILNDDLFSVSNRKAFGDNLFCNQDYLRAIDEYKQILTQVENDTLIYRIGLSYFYMDNHDLALHSFKKLFKRSSFSDDAKLEYLRTFFYKNDYQIFREIVNENEFTVKGYSKEVNQLSVYSHLLDDSTLPDEIDFLNSFESSDQKKVKRFYNWKEDPPYKSPTKGAILSAIIPGLGKVYANEIGDGITGFLLTGLFTYLAIDKFQKDQTASAWLFTATAAFFYGGNIYGSATAVQNYNASIRFNFDNEVNLYLNKRDHFLPPPKYLCD